MAYRLHKEPPKLRMKIEEPSQQADISHQGCVRRHHQAACHT